MPPVTYEGLLLLVICAYALYSTRCHGYAANAELLVLLQAVIHNIVLSPLFGAKKSSSDRFAQLREHPLQIEHRGGVVFCSSLVPLVFATLYTRHASVAVHSALLASVWSSAVTVGVLRGTRGLCAALVECALLTAYWLPLTTPTAVPLTTSLLLCLATLLVAYWLLASIPRSVTWGECTVLAQIGGTLLAWLWLSAPAPALVCVVPAAASSFSERTVPTPLSALLHHVLVSDHCALALNAALFEHVLAALVHSVLRRGLSHVLLSLTSTWLLARGLRWPHSRTFCGVSAISFLGHTLLIARDVFLVPHSVREVTGVNQAPVQASSPWMALVALFLYWAALLLLCLWLVARASTARPDQSRVTRARKWYHVLSLAMFLPPLLLTASHVLDSSHVLVIHALLLVAYPLVLGLGALVEYLRMHHLLFGDAISARFAPLLTNVDRAGPITYSHLALIGGLLGPATLSHVLTDTLLLSLASPHTTARVLTAGLLVLDVADTAASWFGSKYGRVRWSHVLSTRALCAPLAPQRKSLEGSCAAWLALVSVDHVLGALVTCAQSTDHVLTTSHVLVPALLAVLTEALTTQIDNLVLPAVYWTLLVATSP